MTIALTVCKITEVVTMKRAILFGLLGWLAFVLASPLVAQPFTYQGFLKENGQPANGIYDFRFLLWTAPSGGTQVGPELYVDDVSVQNGLFTVQLDFGAVWDGSDRYLEILVRLNDAFGYWLLTPRVKITPAPYASFASSAGFAQRPWQSAGSNIFYNDGNVGIGTSSPAARLSLGGGDANTKLAIWQGANASQVMGLGVGPAQFRLHLNNSSDRFSFLNAPNGSEVMTILGTGNVGIGTSSPSQRLHVEGNGYFSGNVGIGTSSPAARLHVNGGDAHFTNNNTTLQIVPGSLFGQSQANAATLEIPGNGILGIWDTLRTTGDLNVGGSYFTLGGGTDPTWSRVRAYIDALGNNSYVGVIQASGSSGLKKASLDWLTDYPDFGYASVRNRYDVVRARMFVYQNGIGYILADAKLFCVPDPEDVTRDIWYGCIEGPELAMYVRGTARLVNGRARIELPDHFRKLADEQGMTVQMTPLSIDSKGLCVVRKGLDGIEVMELRNGRGNYEFDWEVKAVRKEHRDFQVYRPWDEALPGGTDPAEAWQARLKSIQERQARQQSRTDTKGVQR
jgi:hypothetical protein